MLLMLQDGDFLDSFSDVVQGRFILYNHPLETFATVEMQLSRGPEGAYHGNVCSLLRSSFTSFQYQGNVRSH